MKFQIICHNRGKERIIDSGPLTKMRKRLKSLRASTRKGFCGHQTSPVEYKIVPIVPKDEGVK